MKNLVKRNGTYYFRKLVDGRRKFQSLKTKDKVVAEARCRALSKAAYDGRFEVLDAVRSKRLVCTLGEIFATYKDAAAARGIDDRTAGSYCSQLANIVRKVKGDAFDVEKAPASILTADLISDYVAQAFKAAGKNVLDQERTKTTIRSTVINARSIFARWTFANSVYKKLEMPDVTEFKKIGLPWKTEARVYHRPPEELIDKTIKAGRALRDTNPRLYAVFLLCYDLALRAGEAMAMRRDWFKPHAGDGEVIIHADIFRRPDFKPKWNMERSVPLNTDTWQELQALWVLPDWQVDGKLTPYALPGRDKTDRYNLVNREFATWMRSLGWDPDTYPKAAHELRKLMGSEWFTKITPQFAQEKLGHRNIATTCTFYARLASKPKALPREQAVA